MSKFFILLFLYLSIFSLAQSKKCVIKFDIDTSKIDKTRAVFLKITNVGNKKGKIIRDFIPYKMQLLDVLVFSEKNNEYFSLKEAFVDIDYYYEKKNQILGVNKSKTYKINVLETYQGNKLKSKNKYKFTLNFNLYDFSDCGLTGLYEVKNVEFELK